MNCSKKILALFAFVCLLNACSTGTPELSGLSPQAQAEIIKNYGGIYKVGKPYKIAGKWYYPEENYSYSEVGTASWYGEDFNGKSTANGERYNMNTLTAAHRTLPLPSIVRVTNLQNGRSVILRVNDRGPYVKDRIIDLSKRGAQLLGYMGQGTTKVKVEIMAEESKALKQALLNLSSPQGTALAASSTPAHSLYESSSERVAVSEKEAAKVAAYASAGGVSYAYGSYEPSGKTAEPAVYGSAAQADGGSRKSGALEAAEISASAAGSGSGIYGQAAKNPDKADTTAVKGKAYQYVPGYYYIHAGAFTQYERAHLLMVRLKEYGSSHIVPIWNGGVRFYRVSVGPYSRMEEAKVAQAKLSYYGIENTRIEQK